MKIYYAHPISDYNTQNEKDNILKLEKLGFDVLNPNNPAYEEAYKLQGMQVFLDLINTCDCLVFETFDFGNSPIPAGVYKEILHAEKLGLLVMELPGSLGDRAMSVEATRNLLKQLGAR
jgi:hypothetical protein